MISIKLFTVGKIKTRHWNDAVSGYAARLQHYVSFTQLATREAPKHNQKNPDLARRLEAENIRKKLVPDEFVVALDCTGEQLNSHQFSDFFAKRANRGITRFVFVVGGPVGLERTFIQECDFVLSLSEMTFPHEMAAVLLLEQIYRAQTILRGEQYHK